MVFLFFKQTHLVLGLVILLGAGLIGPAIVNAAPFGATANFRYEHADNDGDQSWRFGQNYNLTYLKELSSSLEFSSSLRYKRDASSEGKDGSRINPSLILDLRNDLFSLVLGANFNRIKEDSEPIDDTWSYSANWMSQWDEIWPALRFNYSESYRTDDAKPSVTDSESRQYGAGINYSWRFLEFFYDFNSSNYTDNILGVSADGERHSVNLNLQDSWNFWDNLLSLSVGQRVNYNYSKDEAKIGVGNDYFLRDFQVRAYYALDSRPEEGELPLNLSLTDGNFQVSAGIDIANPTERHNLGFRPETLAVNRVMVYFTEELEPSQQLLLNWEFYVSEDGDEWHQVLIAPLVRYEYDPLNYLTVAVIDLPFYVERRKYGKLLLSTSSMLIDPVSVSELEAGEHQIATSDTIASDATYINSESQFSLTIRPLEDWLINSSFFYRYTSNDPGAVTKEIHASLFSDYYWNRYFSFVVGVSENRVQDEEVDEEINRSYSLTISSSPLDTFDATLGFSHSEQYEGDTRIETSNSVNAYLTAEPYPDVTASFSANWSDGEDSEVSWRSDATLRLTERMNLDIYCDDLTAYGATFNYHPSDILACSLGVDRDDDAQTNTVNSSISWITSETVRTSLNYFMDDAPEGTNHGLQASLTWDPSDLFTIQNDINYRISRGGADDNRTALYWSLQLNMRW